VKWDREIEGSLPTIESLNEQRRIRETNRISIISTRDIPRMELEDQLFEMYNNFVNDEAHGLRRNRHFLKYPEKIQDLQIL